MLHPLRDFIYFIHKHEPKPAQQASHCQRVGHNVVADEQRFTEWCGSSLINNNVDKTKEMLIDFRKNPTALSSAIIDGQAVEIVKQ